MPKLDQDAHAIRKARVAACGRFKRSLDIHACQVCGWSPGWPLDDGKILHAHHVVPVKSGGSNDSQNMVLLCPNCHAIAHGLFPQSRGRYFGPKDKGAFLDELKKYHSGEREIETKNQLCSSFRGIGENDDDDDGNYPESPDSSTVKESLTVRPAQGSEGLGESVLEEASRAKT